MLKGRVFERIRSEQHRPLSKTITFEIGHAALSRGLNSLVQLTGRQYNTFFGLYLELILYRQEELVTWKKNAKAQHATNHRVKKKKKECWDEN